MLAFQSICQNCNPGLIQQPGKVTENYTEEYALYCRAAQVCFITQVCLFYSQWSWKTKSLNASWCFLSAQQNYPVWFGAGLMLNSFVGGWGVCVCVVVVRQVNMVSWFHIHFTWLCMNTALHKYNRNPFVCVCVVWSHSCLTLFWKSCCCFIPTHASWYITECPGLFIRHRWTREFGFAW